MPPRQFQTHLGAEMRPDYPPDKHPRQQYRLDISLHRMRSGTNQRSNPDNKQARTGGLYRSLAHQIYNSRQYDHTTTNTHQAGQNTDRKSKDYYGWK